MPSILIFIVVLGVLVVVHEFGHFVMARACGIRVEKFSIGFGPVVFGQKRGETEFCVSLLPLGGFVKLAGENPEEAKGLPFEFQSKRFIQKFAVVVAGPLMNALLAFVIFAGVYLVGQPTLSTTVGKIMPGTPAESAGLESGDKILNVDGKSVRLWEDVLLAIRQGGERLEFGIERKGVSQTVEIVTQAREARGFFGKKTTHRFVGIAPSAEIFYERQGFFKAIRLGFLKVCFLTSSIFYSLGLVVTGALPFKDSLTGPIGIFMMTQEAARSGVLVLLNFVASLSVSLFVLNLLPIPVLDGGHLVFFAIEKLKGSPLKESVKERLTQGGLVALMALMAFVILQDVHRFSIFDGLKKLIFG